MKDLGKAFSREVKVLLKYFYYVSIDSILIIIASLIKVTTELYLMWMALNLIN